MLKLKNEHKMKIIKCGLMLLPFMSTMSYATNRVDTLKNVQNINEKINKDKEIKTNAIISGKSESISKVSSIFDYYPDSIYEIYTMPDFLTTIKFAPDEEITFMAGGDVNNWILEKTIGGGDGSTYLYVKPKDVDLSTNLNVVTSKRAYFFNLHSTDNKLNPLVKFVYPLDKYVIGFNNLKPKSDKISKVEEEKLGKVSGLQNTYNLDDLDFAYQISDKKLPISPVRIYSNTNQTYIELKDKLTESPILFVMNNKGEYEVVNYRQENNRLLVDKKINKAALVLGDSRVEIRHK